MILKVPTRKQKKNSLHCGVACLQMVMEFFGDKISYNDLVKQLKVYKGKGIYTTDLGILAMKYSYNTLVVYNKSEVLDKTTENLTEKDIRKLNRYLKKLKESKKPFRRILQIKKDTEFIEAGGKYSTKLPNLDLINKHLKKRFPVIVCLNNRALRSDPDRKSNHFVVVIGKEGNYYIVNDPSTNAKDQYKIERDKLLQAWYLAGAFTLVIYK